MLLALILAFVLGVAWLGCLVVAGVLVGRGVRGRLLDHHPRCRHCGYDLVGTPRRPDRCPECGACLLGVKKIRIGRRRVRPAPVIVGVAMGLLALAPLIVASWPLLRARATAVVPVAAPNGPPTLFAATTSPPVAAVILEPGIPEYLERLLPAAPSEVIKPASAETATDDVPDPEFEALRERWEPPPGTTSPFTWEPLPPELDPRYYDDAVLGPDPPRGPEAVLEAFGAPAPPPAEVPLSLGGPWFDANLLDAWLDPGFTAGSFAVFGNPAMPFGAPPSDVPHWKALRMDPLGNPAIRTQIRSGRYRNAPMSNPGRVPRAGGRGRAKGR